MVHGSEVLIGAPAPAAGSSPVALVVAETLIVRAGSGAHRTEASESAPNVVSGVAGRRRSTSSVGLRLTCLRQ